MKIDKLDVGMYKTRAEMGAGRFIYGVVPGPLKAEAVYHTLRGRLRKNVLRLLFVSTRMRNCFWMRIARNWLNRR